ncbi:hypothetical protein [Thiocystis minor]|uniref:hypothetical protein n=1 Tax=Thiocystis minor TaxID=61597 RepID=UPI0019115427
MAGTALFTASVVFGDALAETVGDPESGFAGGAAFSTGLAVARDPDFDAGFVAAGRGFSFAAGVCKTVSGFGSVLTGASTERACLPPAVASAGAWGDLAEASPDASGAASLGAILLAAVAVLSAALGRAVGPCFDPVGFFAMHSFPTAVSSLGERLTTLLLVYRGRACQKRRIHADTQPRGFV